MGTIWDRMFGNEPAEPAGPSESEVCEGYRLYVERTKAESAEHQRLAIEAAEHEIDLPADDLMRIALVNAHMVRDPAENHAVRAMLAQTYATLALARATIDGHLPPTPPDSTQPDLRSVETGDPWEIEPLPGDLGLMMRGVG